MKKLNPVQLLKKLTYLTGLIILTHAPDTTFFGVVLMLIGKDFNKGIENEQSPKDKA